MSGPRHVSVFLMAYLDRLERQLSGRDESESEYEPVKFTKTPDQHRVELLERFGIKR